jgi:hypothetical protein
MRSIGLGRDHAATLGATGHWLTNHSRADLARHCELRGRWEKIEDRAPPASTWLAAIGTAVSIRPLLVRRSK